MNWKPYAMKVEVLACAAIDWLSCPWNLEVETFICFIIIIIIIIHMCLFMYIYKLCRLFFFISSNNMVLYIQFKTTKWRTDCNSQSYFELKVLTKKKLRDMSVVDWNVTLEERENTAWPWLTFRRGNQQLVGVREEIVWSHGSRSYNLPKVAKAWLKVAYCNSTCQSWLEQRKKSK